MPKHSVSTPWGSSPLTRGKLDRRGRLEGCAGLIPTHAGKTPGAFGHQDQRRAHPHSRGENSARAAAIGPLLGSSPLTRGKPLLRGNSLSFRGLIPTHAGKTRSAPGALRGCRAHPHSRGENLRLYGLGAMNEGSSPLTRGKHDVRDRRLPSRGLIPTHAGKTRRRPARTSGCRAHPHSRGENSDRAVPEGPERGSSPLTRGKHYARRYRRLCPGLIPTHAGKTSRGSPRVCESWAHPHSRGENTTKKRSVPIKTGSSPLTRGKHGLRARVREHPGLIPTHAGKTARRRSARTHHWAHPHSRGENSS